MKLKILTLNTWQQRGPWQARWKLILRGLKKHRPDIIAFQEIFDPQWAKALKIFSGYRYGVFPKHPGGLMVLSSYPVCDWDSIQFKKKSPTEDYFRYAMYVKIMLPFGPLALFNTHLSWRTPESKIRQKQVTELLCYMNRKAKTLPRIAVGDFNSVCSSAEMKLMRRSGYIDSFRFLRPSDPGLTWDNRNFYTAGSSVKMPNRRIDYIWVKSRHNEMRPCEVKLVLKKREDNIYPSDHAGVLVLLKFNDSEVACG